MRHRLPRQPAEPGLLLRISPEFQEGFSNQRIVHGGDDRHDGAGGGQCLDPERIADVIKPGTPPVAGNRDTHQAEGRQFSHQVSGECPLLVDLGGARCQAIAGKFRNSFLEGLLRVGQLENHGPFDYC